MPDMTPVANQVVPPDPTKGINTFGAILGLQQRKQQLALGQQQLQVGQAEVQGAQQQIQARSFMQNMMQTGKDEKGESIRGDDGEPDPDKTIAAINRNVPAHLAQPIVQSIIKTQGDKTQLANANRELDQSSKNDMSGIIRSFVNNPNAKASDITGAIDQYITRNPRAAASGHWASNLVDDHFDNMAPDQKNKALVHAAQMFQPAGSTAAQQAPSPAAVQAPGNKLNFIETNPLAAGGTGTKLGNAVQGLAPAQQLGYVQQAAGASATGGTSAQNDEQLYNDITKNASRVGQIKSFSGEVQNLAKEVKTGKYSKEGAALWTAIAQRVPGFGNAELTDATRRQLLGKYTQQLMLQSEQANGASTDAAQANVRSAMPDPDHMTPEAIIDAARTVSGQADVANTRAQLAMKHRGAQGGTSSQGLRDLDTRFMSQADPRAYVYKDLQPGEDRRDYLRKHPDFKNQLLLKLHQGGQ